MPPRCLQGTDASAEPLLTQAALPASQRLPGMGTQPSSRALAQEHREGEEVTVTQIEPRAPSSPGHGEVAHEMLALLQCQLHQALQGHRIWDCRVPGHSPSIWDCRMHRAQPQHLGLQGPWSLRHTQPQHLGSQSSSPQDTAPACGTSWPLFPAQSSSITLCHELCCNIPGLSLPPRLPSCRKM